MATAPYALPTGAIPWEDTCFPHAGGNVTLPPNKDRQIPLNVYIPAETGVCGSLPVTRSASKPHATPVDYAGPCSTVTDYGYAGAVPTTYRFAPGPGETQGLAVVCEPGEYVPHDCHACSTYTKVVANCPAPVTVYLPPTGTKTDGSVVVITPAPETVTSTQTLPPGSEGFTTTIKPDTPGKPTTVIIGVPVTTTVKYPQGPEKETTTITVPAPPQSTDEEVITATDGGPDTVIVPEPTESDTTTVPEVTEPTTTEYITVGPTYTVHPTEPQPTVAPPVDISCENTGFRYAMIPHNFYNDDAPKYSSCDTEYFRTANPIWVDNIERIGSPPYPGAPDVSLEYMGIMHEAYIYAKVAGEYTFSVSYVDDIGFFWVGDNAYEGWTRENANGVVSSADGSALNLKINLAAGDYYPVRILWVNGQTDFALDLVISNPDGDVIADSNGIDKEYIVSKTCDDAADKFPPFPAVVSPESLGLS